MVILKARERERAREREETEGKKRGNKVVIAQRESTLASCRRWLELKDLSFLTWEIEKKITGINILYLFNV